MHPTALKRFTWALNWPSMIWCVIRFREDYQTVVRPPSANPLSLFSAENHHACISFRPGIHSTIFIQFWDEFWLLQLFFELKTEFQLCCVCVFWCAVYGNRMVGWISCKFWSPPLWGYRTVEAALQTDCPKFSVFSLNAPAWKQKQNHGDISCGLDQSDGGYTVPGSEGPRVYFAHLVWAVKTQLDDPTV